MQLSCGNLKILAIPVKIFFLVQLTEHPVALHLSVDRLFPQTYLDQFFLRMSLFRQNGRLQLLGWPLSRRQNNQFDLL